MDLLQASDSDRPGPSVGVPVVRIFDNIRHLRITLSQANLRESRNGGEHHPLIDPFCNPKLLTLQAMESSMAMDLPTRLSTPIHSSVWAAAFAYMPAIRTLTIDFEANQDESNRKIMGQIVQWASTKWVFPVYPRSPGQPFPKDEMGCLLPTNTWLSPEGNPVRKMSWTRLPSRMPKKCKQCKKRWPLSPKAKEALQKASRYKACTTCFEWHKAAERFYVWTVTWTLKPDVKPTAEEVRLEKEKEAKRFRDIVLPADTEEEFRKGFNYRAAL
ncbi:hypothetical protein B0T14DRAFT_219782 [Immersiella caudata]|uniref:Uncharacterized protein n=1 Tax=Immersiella caudata TaxID=314043 RepID=A0AA39WQV8_9PEZI|nr:hypothetical protein B0T14DRAFT_219782 [Immersiella caudata]